MLEDSWNTLEIVFWYPAQRMSEAGRESMATATITARGSKFREIMARLNSGLRYAFNLSSSSDKRGQSWEGNDGYKAIVVSGSALELWKWSLPIDLKTRPCFDSNKWKIWRTCC